MVDILGPVFSALHDTFGRKPGSQPGLLYAGGRERFDRLDAVDYTLAHDDGCHHDQLGNADVVLVGVSRSGKSSTCFFLALQGVKAANVPFVPGLAPLPELIALPKEHVIGLVVNPNRLIALRGARAKHFGLGAGNAYTDAEKIRQEARDAHRPAYFMIGIEKILRIQFEFFERNRDFFRIYISERGRFEWTVKDDLGKGVHEKMVAYIHLLAQVMKQGIKDGAFKPKDPIDLAHALVGIVNSFVFEWLIAPRPYPLLSKVDTVLDIFLSGAQRTERRR